MTIEIEKVTPLETLLFLMRDESGHAQYMMRIWSVTDAVPVRWLTSNLAQQEWIALDEKQCEFMDDASLEALAVFDPETDKSIKADIAAKKAEKGLVEELIAMLEVLR